MQLSTGFCESPITEFGGVPKVRAAAKLHSVGGSYGPAT